MNNLIFRASLKLKVIPARFGARGHLLNPFVSVSARFLVCSLSTNVYDKRVRLISE